MRRDLNTSGEGGPSIQTLTLRCESVGSKQGLDTPRSPRRTDAYFGGCGLEPWLSELTRYRPPGEYGRKIKTQMN